jgi:hypothetical protein
MNRNRIVQNETFAADRSVHGVSAGGRVTHTPRPGWWKKATCKDINCPQYENGWITVLPTSRVDLIQAIKESGWHYTEERAGDGLVQFMFPAGQTCYRHINGTGHLVPVERDPVFVHRANGHQKVGLDYDQYFSDFNETAYLATKAIKEG